MKKTMYLVLLLCIPIQSLTAQSGIINISKEQKIEVVSTLVAYPLVLNELDLVNQLLDSCSEINMLLNSQLESKDRQILLLENAHEISEEQIELLNIQIKNTRKRSWVLPTLIGLSGGLILGITF